ncbi:MAG: hypothetical protein IPK12_15030 [Gemmatimonadetes bacterium]|nr:hypothetical protein [Gemmatimonadota bacterium]
MSWFSVAVPPLSTWTVTAAGFEPPDVAAKWAVSADSSMTGADATVRVTMTFCGLLPELAEMIGIVAE